MSQGHTRSPVAMSPFACRHVTRSPAAMSPVRLSPNPRGAVLTHKTRGAILTPAKA